VIATSEATHSEAIVNQVGEYANTGIFSSAVRNLLNAFTHRSSSLWIAKFGVSDRGKRGGVDFRYVLCGNILDTRFGGNNHDGKDKSHGTNDTSRSNVSAKRVEHVRPYHRNGRIPVV
jgi:hypothetical protein